MKTNTKLFFLFAVLVAFDQSAKYIFSASLCNQNIAWSISIVPAIFYFAWFSIIFFLLYQLFKSKPFVQKIFIVLILSGAVSNMIDRLRFGCVVDYIDLRFWPVFNLADVYITIGIISLLFVVASAAKQSRVS